MVLDWATKRPGDGVREQARWVVTTGLVAAAGAGYGDDAIARPESGAQRYGGHQASKWARRREIAPVLEPQNQVRDQPRVKKDGVRVNVRFSDGGRLVGGLP